METKHEEYVIKVSTGYNLAASVVNTATILQH